MRNSTDLTTSRQVPDANAIIARTEGIWSAVGTGLTGWPYNVTRALQFGLDGCLYAAGHFGGVPFGNLAKWDGLEWSPLGAGTGEYANDEVYALAVGTDGCIYAGGFFTEIDGVAANRVAKWDPEMSQWSALGAGVDNNVRAMTVGPDGCLYVGGDFVNSGGLTVNHVAKWDPATSQWSALGAGMDNWVFALTFGPDGCLYMGGGTVDSLVQKWNPATSQWSTLGADSGNGTIFALTFGPDGSLYVAGTSTKVGSLTINRVARWNGSQWSALGVGMDGDVYSLLCTPDGLLYAGGRFTSAGGQTISDRVAVWNGSSWAPLDIDLPGSPWVYALAMHGNDLYIGFDTEGTAITSGVAYATTVVNNLSTTRAYPRFVISRSGGTSATLESIKNLSTNQKLLFNYALADGEKVVIDLTPGHKTITSSVLGNAIGKLLPGCDFATWALEPGEQKIALYVSTTGDPTIAAIMQWNDAFLTAVGAAQ